MANMKISDLTAATSVSGTDVVPVVQGGATKKAAVSLLPYAPIVEAVNTVAASGAEQALPDPSVQSISRITLTANCTLTFPAAGPGKSFTLVLVQDGTGSRTVTWPGTVKWPGGTAPTLSTGAGKIDYLSFLCTDGTNWAGFAAGLDVR